MKNFVQTNSKTKNKLLWLASLASILAFVLSPSAFAQSGVMAVTYGPEDLVVEESDPVTGDPHGVEAYNFGAGNTSISVGEATGLSGSGVQAEHYGADLTITATGLVSGELLGVLAYNFGSGATNITTTDVNANQFHGIGALHYGTDLNITSTGTITSNLTGIVGYNFGTGAMNINANNITSAADLGIFARNFSGATDLNINVTGTIDSAFDGILAQNGGTGALSITANNILSSDGNGIDATNNGTDMTITTTGKVAADQEGILADNSGSGALTINVNDVSSENNVVIRAENYGTDLTVNATGTVSGLGGMFAFQYGSGDLTLNVNNVMGTSGDGLGAANLGKHVNINATGDLMAVGNALIALNLGGDVTAMVNNVTSSDEIAIYIRNYAGSGAINLTSNGDVVGAVGGMYLINEGNGMTNVWVNGAVTGQGDFGIYSLSDMGHNIVLNDGANVSGPFAGIALLGIDGDSVTDDTVTLNAGSMVTNGIYFLNGADTLNVNDGVTDFALGGDGIDTVNFGGSGGTLANTGASGDWLDEFEIFNFNMGGYDLAGVHIDLMQLNFLSGTNTISGAVTSTATTIYSGATLDGANGGMLTGGLWNNGSMTIAADGWGSFSIDGDYTQGTGGAIHFDVLGAGSDMLMVSGDTNLDGTININDRTTSSGSHILINGGGALNGTFSTVNLETGLLISRTLDYVAADSDVVLNTTFNDVSSINGLSEDQASMATNLMQMLGNLDNSSPMADLIFNNLAVLDDVTGLQNLLDELAPQGLDGGVQSLHSMQAGFMSSALAQGGDGGLASGLWGSGLTSRSNVASVRPDSHSMNLASNAFTDMHGRKAWVSADFYNMESDSSANASGFSGSGFGLNTGISGIDFYGASLGVALGYSRMESDSKETLQDMNESSFVHGALSMHIPIRNENGMGAEIGLVAGYSMGDNEILMRTLDQNNNMVEQRGTADMRSVGIAGRVTFDGAQGSNWGMKPFIGVGHQTVTQEAFTLGSGGGANVLNVAENKQSKNYANIGATTGGQLSPSWHWNGGLTATRYFGDTGNNYSASFANAPTGSGSFTTHGTEVEQQYRGDARLSYSPAGSGGALSAGGFIEAGDLEVYGAEIRYSTRF